MAGAVEGEGMLGGLVVVGLVVVGVATLVAARHGRRPWAALGCEHHAIWDWERPGLRCLHCLQPLGVRWHDGPPEGVAVSLSPRAPTTR